MSEIVRHGVTRRWSDAVVHRGVAYFVEVPDDLNTSAAEQIRQVLRQVQSRLQSLGGDLTRLLQVTIYLPEPADFAEFNQQWDAWVPEGHAPSRACIHAKLANPALRVELIITASVSQAEN